MFFVYLWDNGESQLCGPFDTREDAISWLDDCVGDEDSEWAHGIVTELPVLHRKG